MKPTIENYSYGPHERNVFDLYLADFNEPTPLLFLVHGGGFISGDKTTITKDIPLEACIKAGISVSSTNYRLTDSAPFPAQMHDCARALQIIRHNAAEWNIDTTRVAASGDSAGAGISQWLAYHEDMANSESEDPISRQSTHLTCIILMQAQAMYDPRIIKRIIPGNAYDHVAMKRLFDVPDDFDWNSGDITDEVAARINECGPSSLLTENAPPMLVKYQKKHEKKGEIHHPNFGKYLKEKADRLGVECRIVIDTDYEDGDEGFYMDYVKFLTKHFGIEKKLKDNTSDKELKATR